MIQRDEVIFLNNHIAILSKNCKKGVIIGANSTTLFGFYHFNIPFYVRHIDYSSPTTEVISLYGYLWFLQKQRIYIRVDPERTYLNDTNLKLSDYMKQRQSMSLFQQFVYNNSHRYHISVPVNDLNYFNIVRVHN